jgi:hypothetical protein
MQILERIKVALQRIARPQPRYPEPPGHPDDPYALVGAPKKPRTPLRSAAVALELPKE